VSLRTGQVAQRAGVNVETIPYYERRGLIERPLRSLGGHRTYPDDTVALLGVIKAAQRLGFTLDEVAQIRSRMAGPRSRSCSKPEGPAIRLRICATGRSRRSPRSSRRWPTSAPSVHLCNR
jgi:DNA-binding transcriptional MerR regulator